MKTGFLFIVTLFFVACAHKISIISVPPGADVYVLTEDGQRGKQLGQTPLTIRDSSKALLGMEINKPGYIPSFVYLPLQGQSSDVKAKVGLIQTDKEWFRTALLDTQALVFNESIMDILELQSLIANGKEIEVEAYLKKLGNRYKRVSAYHSLLGNYYYLKKQMKPAKESYEKALELDPKNDEARIMYDFLTNKEGK